MYTNGSNSALKRRELYDCYNPYVPPSGVYKWRYLKDRQRLKDQPHIRLQIEDTVIFETNEFSPGSRDHIIEEIERLLKRS
ncbi:hypothetical protein NEF87_000233 [Candidatus Lokiarchaeum ossiferum]|uniref:Uncharacterized protein n=1 Tax=Candidatus Lokiarchaeum ossiferum TaxID=2951803 RepID=A0ABY6HKB7_9ARCH|nr:hypothetical protein NEF87_000233 [Candidatus Lokiarchaeum sp. B-35]